MSTENTETVVTPPSGLPGSLLRQAREEKGLTIDEMSAISNLTKQVIRGIESDDYSELAGLSFVRGYLKLYAKKLGVNEADILEPFDRWKAEQSGEPIQTISTTGVGVQEPSSGPSQGVMIAAAAVVVVLIAAGAVISYIDSDDPEPEIAVVLPQDEQSDLPPATQSESGEAITTDENSAQTVIADADESAESGADALAENQESAAETSVESLTAESSAESTAAEEPQVAEADNPEQVAQAEPAPVERQSEPEKPVEAPEPPKVVKKVKPKVEKPVAEKVEKKEDKPVVVSPSNLSQGGRVIAEASGLARAPTEPVQTTQVSPGQDDGLRVLSETVTGPTADQLAMGARGRLEIVFTGESWVEVRDARGRLVLADLMTPEKGVNLDTYGPIEVLVGAVSVSTVTFNGEAQDLEKKAYQDVARIMLGAETN
jgi:cytoskeleton protein RodZ